jgi:hypothetical protein
MRHVVRTPIPTFLTVLIALLYIPLLFTGDGLNLDVAKTSRYGSNLGT